MAAGEEVKITAAENGYIVETSYHSLSCTPSVYTGLPEVFQALKEYFEPDNNHLWIPGIKEETHE